MPSGNSCQQGWFLISPRETGTFVLSTIPTVLTFQASDTHSLLRPEAIESFFVLYRVSGDEKYRDWGWEIFNAIEKYAKVQISMNMLV